MDIFFLPPVYLIVMVGAGIITGAIFDQIVQRQYLAASGLLFALFTVSQLIFRIILQEEPARLVGQLIYFLAFLIVAGISAHVKKRILTKSLPSGQTR